MVFSISVGIDVAAGYTALLMTDKDTAELKVGRLKIVCDTGPFTDTEEVRYSVLCTDIEVDGVILRDETGAPLEELVAGDRRSGSLQDGQQICVYPGKVVEHPDAKFPAKVTMSSALGGGGNDTK